MSEVNVNSQPNSRRGEQSDLARRLGISRQAVHEILAGKRVPGSKMSKKLEAATGIPRACWMYPEEFPNPMIKRKSGDGNGTESDPA